MPPFHSRSYLYLSLSTQVVVSLSLLRREIRLPIQLLRSPSDETEGSGRRRRSTDWPRSDRFTNVCFFLKIRLLPLPSLCWKNILQVLRSSKILVNVLPATDVIS